MKTLWYLTRSSAISHSNCWVGMPVISAMKARRWRMNSRARSSLEVMRQPSLKMRSTYLFTAWRRNESVAMAAAMSVSSNGGSSNSTFWPERLAVKTRPGYRWRLISCCRLRLGASAIGRPAMPARTLRRSWIMASPSEVDPNVLLGPGELDENRTGGGGRVSAHLGVAAEVLRQAAGDDVHPLAGHKPIGGVVDLVDDLRDLQSLVGMS